MYLVHITMTACYYHITYTFQGESSLCSCFNVKESLLEKGAISEVIIDSNGIRTHNHLVRKRTLNHLVKLASLAKWLNVCLRTKWLWVRIPLLSVNAYNYII